MAVGKPGSLDGLCPVGVSGDFVLPNAESLSMESVF